MTTVVRPRAAVIGTTAGVLLTAAGWLGTSGQSTPSDQMVWVQLAVVGTGLVVMANARWLLAGRRAVNRYYRQVSTAVPLTLDALGSFSGVEYGAAVGERRLVAVPAMRWYHRPECELTAGKAVTADSRQTHETAGRRRCGVCRP